MGVVGAMQPLEGAGRSLLSLANCWHDLAREGAMSVIAARAVSVSKRTTRVKSTTSGLLRNPIRQPVDNNSTRCICNCSTQAEASRAPKQACNRALNYVPEL